MINHIVRAAATIGGASLCTVLPFLPGRYDALALPVSMMAQVLAILGLALVPLGAVWMAFEYRGLRTRRRSFATVALFMCAVAWALASLAVMTETVILAAIALMIGTYVVIRLLPRVRSLGDDPSARAARVVPLYLITVPIGVAAVQLLIADAITEFSRNRAIRNSESLIADIEAYRSANGRYPASVVSVHPDYKPSVLGIKEYRYEPSDDAYNVLFGQHSLRLGTQEIVMYNPRDRQSIASHALDVLQLSPAQLAIDRARGHYAVHEARQAHWKYFWFD